MKKMFLLFLLLSLPVFATDIPYTNNSYTSTTCDSGVLQHDSGTVRLRARYEPNKMNIRWYDNNTEITPTNAAANTCDYGDDLILPTNNLTRTGYTFAGWRVRPLMDFRTLDLSNPLPYYGKGGSGYCGYRDETSKWREGSAVCKINEFAKLNQHEWEAFFTSGTDQGTLYGMARCSKKPGSAQPATTDELDTYNGPDAATRARYCWCKVTGWKPSNQTTVYGSAYPLGWVFSSDWGVDCYAGCSLGCVKWLVTVQALFSPITNSD